MVQATGRGSYEGCVGASSRGLLQGLPGMHGAPSANAGVCAESAFGACSVIEQRGPAHRAHGKATACATQPIYPIWPPPSLARPACARPCSTRTCTSSIHACRSRLSSCWLAPCGRSEVLRVLACRAHCATARTLPGPSTHPLPHTRPVCLARGPRVVHAHRAW